MTGSVLFFNLAMIIFVGLINGLTPYISRKEMPFGVSMPLTRETIPVINAKKKIYFVINLGLSVIFSILLFILWQFVHKTEETIVYISTISIFLLLIISFIVYIRQNSDMKLYKKTLNLSEADSQKVLVDLSFRQKKLIFPTGYLVAMNIVFILVTAFVTGINYSHIPDRIVIHWDLNWKPNGIVDKSWLTVFFIPFFQAFLTIQMAIANQAFSDAQQEINPNAPKKSLYQDKEFRKSSSLLLYIISIVIQCLFTSVQFFIIFPNQKSLKYLMMGSTFFVPIAIIIVTLWYSLYYGQGGNRLKGTDNSSQITEQQVKDDSHWKWGMFYFNREDPSFWVEKRMGVGVTVNFAKWQAWFFLILTLVVPIVITLLIL